MDPMNDMPRIALLIVGMHRSGTSAMAGSLARLGVPLGARLLAAGEDNPKGYFEHEDAVRLDDALLDRLDRRWDDPRPLPEGWLQGAAAAEARREIGRLLEREFAGAPLFALKDPRMCRLLPLWIDALRAAAVEPRVLLVVRHPSEVAASLHRRDGFGAALSERLWLEHMLAAERDSRGCRRAVATYDALLAAPAQVLQQAVHALGLDPLIPTGTGAALSGFVSAGDRHFAGGAAARPEGAGDGIAEAAFALFADGTLDGAGFDTLQQRLDARHAPAAALVEALAARALQAERAAEQQAVASSELRSRLNAQVAWSDAAVVEREGLQAALAETRSALTAQIAWSDAAVVERDGLHVALAGARDALECERQRADALQLKISRYEATLPGRLLRRWLAWRDNRRNGERT